MMARISCSRTSKETSCSAFTPPKASETLSTDRMTSPTRRPWARRSSVTWARSTLGGLPRRFRGKGLRVADLEVRRESTRAPVFVAHARFDMDALLVVVQGLDQRPVLLADEAPPDLARAGELLVVRVQLLVQDQEAVDLGVGELGLAREVRIDL